MSRHHIYGLILTYALVVSASFGERAWGDDFARFDGGLLTAAARGEGSKERNFVGFAEIGAAPRTLRDSGHALLIVKTDQGNAARVLVSAALRKPTGGGEPTPVVVLERFDTFESPQAKTRLAGGKGTLLFDGFRFDFDSGQVVPDGHGGDVRFRLTGKEGSGLTTAPGAKLYTLDAPPVFPVQANDRPSPGGRVTVGDFRGSYRLYADARWSGDLSIKVNDKGEVSGEFRSDLNGRSYAVRGISGGDSPGKIVFEIAFPRSKQEYEGYLWTSGKGGFSGTLRFLNQTFGFFAIRKGGRFAPEDALAEGAGGELEGDAAGKIVVTIDRATEGVSIDGKNQDIKTMKSVIVERVAADTAVSVLIRVASDVPYSRVREVVESIRSAGVERVRFESR